MLRTEFLELAILFSCQSLQFLDVRNLVRKLPLNNRQRLSVSCDGLQSQHLSFQPSNLLFPLAQLLLRRLQRIDLGH